MNLTKRVSSSKKKQKKKWILYLIFFIFLGIFIFISSYAYMQFKRIKGDSLPKSDDEIGVKEIPSTMKDDDGKEYKSHDVRNILLLGVDNEEDASDSIIVFSLDNTAKSIKMSSLMRDSYIYFGEDKVNKLNYAYHYGGSQLAVKTINENYNLDIRDYVKVDFGALDKIVDAFGGVDVDLKPEEVKLLNSHVNDIAKIEKTEAKYLKGSGLQRLNGQQVVAYCRIRYVGNHDYERTERQRRVLKALFARTKDIPVASYPKVLSDISPYLETSLDFTEMLSLGTKVMNYGSNDIKESRVPYDGYKSDDTIKGIFYLKWDKEKNVELLHKFIYLD